MPSEWKNGMLEYWNIGYKIGINLFIKLRVRGVFLLEAQIKRNE